MAEWGKVYGSLHGSPKWRRASKGARALWTTALSWCIDQESSEGAVPTDMLRVLDGSRAEADILVSVGLWEPAEDGWRFHDWHERQRSREQIRRDREAAAERQRRARARRNGVTTEDGSPVSHGVTDGVSHASRGEESRGEEKEEPSSEVADAPLRPEIEKILDHLDDRLRANGSKIPTRTKKNLDAARLLLERDNRTVDQVLACIDFATGDEFWRVNVLSMSKLREKYDQLRQAAQRNRPGAPGTPRPASPPRDQLSW